MTTTETKPVTFDDAVALIREYIDTEQLPEPHAISVNVYMGRLLSANVHLDAAPSAMPTLPPIEEWRVIDSGAPFPVLDVTHGDVEITIIAKLEAVAA